MVSPVGGGPAGAAWKEAAILSKPRKTAGPNPSAGVSSNLCCKGNVSIGTYDLLASTGQDAAPRTASLQSSVTYLYASP